MTVLYDNHCLYVMNYFPACACRTVPFSPGGKNEEIVLIISCVPWVRQLGNAGYVSNIVEEVTREQEGKKPWRLEQSPLKIIKLMGLVA